MESVDAAGAVLKAQVSEALIGAKASKRDYWRMNEFFAESFAKK